MGTLSQSLAMRFLDPTLGLLEAGGISIAVIIHSLDRSKRENRGFDDPRSQPTRRTDAR